MYESECGTTSSELLVSMCKHQSSQKTIVLKTKFSLVKLKKTYEKIVSSCKKNLPIGGS